MEIVVRATLVYFFLLFVMRAMGKRELAELSAFELILIVIFGDIVQQGVTQEDMSITGAVLSVGTIALWIVLFSWISFRSRSARDVFEGVPVVLVSDGQPVAQALRTERISVDEILESAREHGIDDLATVRYAVLERSGKISFVERDARGEHQQSSDDTQRRF